jgi:phosphatidate cytidylyltransferase
VTANNLDNPSEPAGPDQGSRNLVVRILAALVLVPVAIGLAYAGGWLWLALVALTAIGLFLEWLLVVGNLGQRFVVGAGFVVLVAAAVCLALGRADYALAVVVVGIVVAIASAPRHRGWSAAGLGYASAALIASVLLRQDSAWGFTALMLVLLIVWVTDIGGYFAGRGIGGPKLWPRVSPKKTWAGAIGGFVASLAIAVGFAAFSLGKILPLLLLSAALTIASQLGDLFESAVKRNFGVKDSSRIIPGHGGLLDRLDGYVFAVVLAALIGVLRGGADGVGHGLMVW